MGIDAVMDEITKNKGVLYDPEAVDACLRLFDEKNDQGAAWQIPVVIVQEGFIPYR